MSSASSEAVAGGSGGTNSGSSSNPPSKDLHAESNAGFNRYACCYRYAHECPYFVWQNGDACGTCLSKGRRSKREAAPQRTMQTPKLVRRRRNVEESFFPRPTVSVDSFGDQQSTE